MKKSKIICILALLVLVLAVLVFNRNVKKGILPISSLEPGMTLKEVEKLNILL